MHLFKSKFQTAVRDLGVEADSLTLTFDTPTTITEKDITLYHASSDLSGVIPAKIKEIKQLDETTVQLFFTPLLLHEDTSIEVQMENETFQITRANADQVRVEGLDDFQALQEESLIFRLYQPKASSPRPLILFLHGGGECGSDNLLPMIGTMGSLELKKRYPDMVILAPQAPNQNLTMEYLLKNGGFFTSFDDCDLGKLPDYGDKSRGWNRTYLALVADKIRQMICSGIVDPARIYLTGMSMGGGGSLEMLSVAPDLFAGALILCPSMNSGTWPILANLPTVPTWIGTAYIDHQINRHALLERACMKLWEEGRRDVKLTLFTSEELKKYGLGCHAGLTDPQIREENHNCWTLAYHNELGMLDWLLSQRKN